MRWIGAITSYFPSILNKINHFFTLGVNQEDPQGIYLENELVRVSLAKKRKVFFYLFYCSFVISYMVCFFIIAYTYPLKPTCHIEKFYLPAFEDDLSATKEMKELRSVYLVISINNRNRLISASYDQFNITVYYLQTRNTSIIFANIIAPGFNQHKPGKTKLIQVHMRVPGLLQLQRPLSKVPFRVNLEFTVRFHRTAPSKRKQHFIRISTSTIHLMDRTRDDEDIVMMK